MRKQREANGLREEHIEFSDAALLEIIRRYTRESGVRNLERELASICRKVAREVVKHGASARKVRVGPPAVKRYLGVARFRFGQAEIENQVGVCTGLAYTETGGELLQTEISVTPGKGKLQVTGRLGEVMQESANAAMSYVRSRAKQLGLARDFYSKVDIHIHVPEGATPKDGPSAGITIATAIASALTRVRNLEREIAAVCRKIARGVARGTRELRTVVSVPNLERFLGVPRHHRARPNSRTRSASPPAWPGRSPAATCSRSRRP